jgi:Ring finger domain
LIQLASSYDSAETGGTYEESDDDDEEMDNNNNVVDFDDECASTTNSSSSSNVQQQHQQEDEEEEDYEEQQQQDEDSDAKECPICMETFSVGDIVSWSPNTKTSCTHVFHHECIKEWLLRSGNCPCCREVVLPIDAPDFQNHLNSNNENNKDDTNRNNNTNSLLKELSILRSKKAATTYYCLTHGLVMLTGKNNKHKHNLINRESGEGVCGGSSTTVNKSCTHSSALKCNRHTYECIKSVTQCSIKGTDLCQFRRSRIHGGENNGGGGSSSTSSHDASNTAPDHGDIETGSGNRGSSNNNDRASSTTTTTSANMSRTSVVLQSRHQQRDCDDALLNGENAV